ncbi:HAD family hydrolase [Candidatus Competibacter phosphatis]|uniref:HAD family hydrolase n=1 Tax=Candidatus Competibacter phosphatis TaxID=221280 RepID=A0ABX1TKF4_9GAMM|nr:HAD-IA family hydrolase [Candidatus Competibacter phosphatis]NMQ19172.1 HAD family hydrolase [Candidatus Competibacter phosphatis]
MIDAVLFDAYGTIFDEGKESIPVISREIVEKHDPGISADEFFQQWKTIYLAIENTVFLQKRSYQTIRSMNIESLSQMFTRHAIKDNPELYVDRLFRRWSYPDLFPEVQSVLAELRASHVIGIISNTDNFTLVSALNHASIEVDYVLSSEDARSYKPNPEIFRRCEADLGRRGERLAYVGNSAHDVTGAKGAGWLMIHVNRRGDNLKDLGYVPDHEISTLDPVSRIIGEMAG